MNRYAYVLNSPLSAVDPSGMDPIDINFIWQGSSGGGGVVFVGGLGGPFGGGNVFGGLGFGNLGLCFTFNCGFGGGGLGASIPGPPSAGQIASEASLSPGGSTASNIATGVVGELYNDVRPFAIFTALQSGNLWDAWRFYKLPEYVPQNSTQKWAARATAAATIFIPGAGEEAATAKLESKVTGRLVNEVHHLLPKQFGAFFRRVGLDIEKYTIPLDRTEHRLLPDGLHTGPRNWNRLWSEWIAGNPNVKGSEILQQLVKMMSDKGLLK